MTTLRSYVCISSDPLRVMDKDNNISVSMMLKCVELSVGNVTAFGTRNNKACEIPFNFNQSIFLCTILEFDLKLSFKLKKLFWETYSAVIFQYKSD